jgi:hypothetical protein
MRKKKGSIRITKTRKGTTIRFTGTAAQAAFDALARRNELFDPLRKKRN